MPSGDWLKDDVIDFEFTIVTFFVCLEFMASFENCSLIWICDRCRYRDAKFDLCSELMAIALNGFCNEPHLLWNGLTVIMVISEDPWHKHLFPSVWQWSCHYLFLRLRSVATGDRSPIVLTSWMVKFKNIFNGKV